MKTIISSILITLLTIFSVIAFGTVEKSAPFNTYSTSTTTDINVSCAINISGFPSLARTGENVTSHVINVTILNKSSLLGAYGILNYSISSVVANATNASDGGGNFWNLTITLTEERHWIQCNFTNATSGGALTNVTAIEIDVDYNIMTIGNNVINFSIDTGNINISGILSADGGIVSGGTITSSGAFTLNNNLLVTSTPLNITNTGNINTSGIISGRQLYVQNHSTGNDVGCDGVIEGTIIFNSTTPGYFFGCTREGWMNLTSQP